MQLVIWIGISYSKYADWKDRYGKANEHNCMIPRDHWLDEVEKQSELPVSVRSHERD